MGPNATVLEHRDSNGRSWTTIERTHPGRTACREVLALDQAIAYADGSERAMSAGATYWRDVAALEEDLGRRNERLLSIRLAKSYRSRMLDAHSMKEFLRTLRAEAVAA